MNAGREMRLPTHSRQSAGRVILPAFAAMVLGGCVQVSAPEKPIEINLNINIRQEVVVRLTEDVRALRQREPGVF